jgi:mutator protein MutT
VIVNRIVVCAAVIERDGRFLITKRQKGVHLEGLWEFPGGKCDPGETLVACLARELREELDVDVTVGEEVFTTVRLFRALGRAAFPELQAEREPTPQQGQEMQWAARADLSHLPFPPADVELILELTRQA